MKRKRKSLPPSQSDLFDSTLPLCPDCDGAGRKLFSVSAKGSGTNGDWMMMRFSAQAQGTWDKLDPEMRELIEKMCERAKFTPGEREYMACPRCKGSGRLKPDVEGEYQRNELLARAFWKSRGYGS